MNCEGRERVLIQGGLDWIGLSPLSLTVSLLDYLFILHTTESI